MILIKDILSKASEKQIMEYYWNERLQENVAMYKNPMRHDNYPTCYFKWDKGRFRFVDPAKDTYFDCFDYVRWLFRCSLSEALKRIQNDMQLNLTYDLVNSSSNKIKVNKKKRKTCFKIKLREWNNYDRDYWGQFGINVKTVDKIGKPVQSYSSNSNGFNFSQVYEYDYQNPCYVYTFKENVKFYCPYSNKMKWTSNTNSGDIFGYNLLPFFGEELFIASGGKDMMCLIEMGFNSIAFQSELICNDEILELLKQRFKRIYVIYDNDETGLEASRKLCDKHKLTNIVLDNLPSVKDIADLCKLVGINKAKQIINERKHQVNCTESITRSISTSNDNRTNATEDEHGFFLVENPSSIV
jgi:hypothetical protein